MENSATHEKLRISLSESMNRISASAISLVGDSKYFNKNMDSRSISRLLDSSSDKQKLRAMKILTSMISIGRDASSNFADVVKNISSSNSEVKRLVYIYVIHYSEQNPELALLSINSFQKDLGSSSERVRSNALKAISSMRLTVVLPLVLLALKTAISDHSPYVRRTAAHAIPKVFRLDHSLKDELIDMIEKLLGDEHVYVLSGTLFAFMQVCPTMYQLIHPQFRKLCHVLADMDEWGQTIALNLFLRYGRNQFAAPQELEYDETDDEGCSRARSISKFSMDPDHKLILTSTENLLYSKNSSVVLGVVVLYHYLAPTYECKKCIPFLMHFLYSSTEVQCVILANISTISASRPALFAPYMKNFYVLSTDSQSSRELKLDILVNLATSSSIKMILNEFKFYIKEPNQLFVSATIEAIGRCAFRVNDFSDICLKELVALVSSSTDSIVAKSIIVICHLLQKHPKRRIIKNLTKSLDTVEIPEARASLVWIIGEYREMIPEIVPDVLRCLAKNFTNEEDEVKLQILNLAFKMFLLNPKTTQLLFKYVLDLCKFDLNYDIRDRARFIKRVFLSKKKNNKDLSVKTDLESQESAAVRTVVQEMLLSVKPTSEEYGPFHDRTRFVLGSLSHFVSHSVGGSYKALEGFQPADCVPDSSTRDRKDDEKSKKFSENFFGSDLGSESESEGGRSQLSSSCSLSDSSGRSDISNLYSSYSEHASCSSDIDSNSHRSSAGEILSDFESDQYIDESTLSSVVSADETGSQSPQEQNVEELEILTSAQTTTKDDKFDSDNEGSLSRSGSQSSQEDILSSPRNQPVSPEKGEQEDDGIIALDQSLIDMTIKDDLIVDHYSSNSSVMPRALENLSENLKAPRKLISLENSHNFECDPTSSHRKQIQQFGKITYMEPGSSQKAEILVDFYGKIEGVDFSICSSHGSFPIHLKCPVGELIRPYGISHETFGLYQKKLSGMNENVDTIEVNPRANLREHVLTVLNVMPLQHLSNSSKTYRFSGKLIHNGYTVLVEIVPDEKSDKMVLCRVNCKDFMLCDRILISLKERIGNNTE
eukprot:714077_1